MNSKVVVGESKYQFLKILQNSKVVKESVGALFNSSPPYAYFGFLHKANLATEGFNREIKEIEKKGKRRRRKRKKTPYAFSGFLNKAKFGNRRL